MGLLAVAILYGRLPRGFSRGLLERVSPDAVAYLGDAERRDSLEELASIPKPVYLVSGGRDDTYIVKLLSEKHTRVDGRFVYAGNSVYVAGVGGREPLTNIESLAREYTSVGLQPHCTILLSYYPPHRVMDESVLGVYCGVYELNELIKLVKPVVVAVARAKPQTVWLDSTCFISPGRAGDGCIGVVEVEAGGGGCRASCKTLCFNPAP